ncbi:MAG: glutamate racemase [Patescibacteria group bacterium]|nr:glutamate racemase [Patescibacteria group bacterium]
MIGIFDSGIGGLTVVKEVLRQLPDYQIVYFGDTARTPYGSKSPETVTKYALQDAQFLIDQGAQIIIVACHTASAVAAEELKKHLAVPIFEVVSPAIRKALAVTRKKRLGIIGTSATIASGIYQRRLKEADRELELITQACPLFVPLVEERWVKKPETKMIARRYLYPLKLKQIDTLVLACTHYPLMREIIQQKIGQRVKLVDPAAEVVQEVGQYLKQHPELEQKLTRGQEHKFYVSDITDKTRQSAKDWLERPVRLEKHLLE